MKVIYYKRNAKSSFHIHAGSYADCFYLPNEKVILIKEQHGSFGGQDYSITDRIEMLNEAITIAEGRTLEVGGVTFSNIKEFEYGGSTLKELIKNTRLKAELQTKVKLGIEDLLKQIK